MTIYVSITAPRAHAKVGRRLNVLALENGVPPGAYSIGTRVETSVNRLYELLSELSGKDLSPERDPAKSGEQLRSCVDPSLARCIIGWRLEVDLASGVKKTLQFFGAL